jgi:DNA-directed RNA polymerase sigma subunit (sigma70/sigma32)
MKPANLSGGMTMRQVASQLGISYQRVQQIEKKALARLRLALLRRGLSEADAIDFLRELARK